MQFRDILALPYEPGSGRPSLDALTEAVPKSPAEVVAQFYAEHGRNPDFQDQYADLELDTIVWTRESIPASELIAASKYERFDNWFDSVRKRFSSFTEKGWRAIDNRRSVVEHWERNGSWAVAPVFLSGGLVGRTQRLHLVEGHTRLATLAGAVECGLIDPGTLHEIWVGTAKD